MRISTNMSALTSCYQLQKSDKKLSNSLLKLSSGYKINSAEDDPVGSAISNKMKLQLRGLERAGKNAADGTSIVETAEGALNEIVDMVQRMNQLAIQGSNGVLSSAERDSLQREVDMLKDEINRIAKDTEFNTKGLLDGEMARKSYTSLAGVKVDYTSDTVPAAAYRINIRSLATKAEYTGTAVQTPADGKFVAGSVSVNGEVVEIKEGSGIDQVLESIKSVADLNDISVDFENNTIKFTSGYEGSKYPVKVECSADLAIQLGLAQETEVFGKDAEVEPVMANDLYVFPKSTTTEIDGNDAVFKASGGFEMRVSLADYTDITNTAGTPGVSVKLEVLEIGEMTIQMGANEGEVLKIEIPEISTKLMGLDKINLKTEDGCTKAIDACSKALSYVSGIRSKLGAYSNRMEHAIASLDVTNENLTASLSRIEDVDMAEEMTKYTSQNVVTQAATSMLAQANQLPERVLQLLQ